MNSSFFYRSVRIRRHHNSITHIFDINGRDNIDCPSIENIFVDHFTKIWNNPDPRPLDWFLNALPPDLLTLSSDQQMALTRPVSKDEIHITLLSLSDGKSSGPDGMNVEFFKFF